MVKEKYFGTPKEIILAWFQNQMSKAIQTLWLYKRIRTVVNHIAEWDLELAIFSNYPILAATTQK